MILLDVGGTWLCADFAPDALSADVDDVESSGGDVVLGATVDLRPEEAFGERAEPVEDPTEDLGAGSDVFDEQYSSFRLAHPRQLASAPKGVGYGTEHARRSQTVKAGVVEGKGFHVGHF